ncbi:neprilysin-11-like [Prorops nasuta]|uniref:neprilysin-11-like n=1 Tax=Prorops nasuta TaxID=863751 RepID=UPI0034CE6B9E
MNNIFFCILISLTSVFAYKELWFDPDYVFPMDPQNYEVCGTEKCQQIAQEFKNAMDFETIPCDDYYKHVCNNWKMYNPIQGGRSGNRPVSQATETVRNRIKAILGDSNSRTKTRALQIAKALYRMCVNNEILDKRRIESVFHVLRSIGHWPMMHQTQVSCSLLDAWQPFFRKVIHAFQPVSLFLVGYVSDKTSHVRRIKIAQPTLKLPRSRNASVVRESSTFNCHKKSSIYTITTLFKQILPSYDHDKLLQDIDDMWELELSLAEISIKPANKQVVTFNNYNLITIEQFQEIYDDHGGTVPNAKIDWLEMLQLALRPAGIEISKFELIDVEEIEYFKKLPDVLKKHSNRTIVNFVFWKILHSCLSFFNLNTLGKETEECDEETSDKIRQKDRETTCASEVNLEKAISYEYVTRYFKPEVKQKATLYIEFIANATEDLIQEISWMDARTKAMSLEKIKSIIKLIGHPDYSASDIDKHYQNYNLGSTYVESICNLIRFNRIQDWKLFRKPISRSDWTAPPTVINGYYSHTANNIIITAAFMEPPMFDIDRPDVFNFAIFGTAIAHEFSHAFDSEGHRYDKDGNLGNWWTPKMYYEFNIRAQCFIYQFSNFVVPELAELTNNKLKVDGAYTSKENIADTTGLQIAFYALINFLSKTGNRDIRLVGLEQLNTLKLFFLQFAHFFCSNMKPVTLAIIATSDTHAPGSLRVRGSIQNSRDFSLVYNCTHLSNMNPIRKCSILH